MDLSCEENGFGLKANGFGTVFKMGGIRVVNTWSWWRMVYFLHKASETDKFK
jgi:hypothetical protein